MSNLNLKGIWIPIEILTDDKLSDKEKIIYAIIIYLSKENQYCFLTNKTISKLLNISVTQVSNFWASQFWTEKHNYVLYVTFDETDKVKTTSLKERP